MASTYTISPDGTTMTFNLNVTTIRTGDVQTYVQYQSLLTTIILQTNVTTIEPSAFSGCTNLTAVICNTPNLTTIGANAFLNCRALPNISLPDTVTTIGASAFRFCTALTILLPPFNLLPSNLVILGAGAFQYAGLSFPPLFPPGIATIPDSTFANSTIAGAITIPQVGEAITAIGPSAFQNCIGITQLTIGSAITDISASAFQGCTGITTPLSIPASVVNIGPNAFNGASGITGLTLRNGLNGIGTYAFANCVNIGGNVIIPPTVAYVDAYAFSNCIGTAGFTYTSSTVVDPTAFNGTNSPITIIQAIQPPTDISGTTTTSSIYLRWTPPTYTGGLAIQSYTITDVTLSRAYTTSDVSYNVTGLNFGTPYTYTITAFNGVSRSSSSAPVTITTVPKTPVTFTFDPTHLIQTYTGETAIRADVSCNPAVPQSFINPVIYRNNTYSSTTPPTNVGNYIVDVSLNSTNPLYYGDSSSSLVINPLATSIIVSQQIEYYTGNPLFVSINTIPPNVSYLATYTPRPPNTDLSHTQVGVYDVSINITNPNYSGSASSTLFILEVPPTIIFSNTIQAYTGSPLSIGVVTVPISYHVDVSYNYPPVSSNPPTNPGLYFVTANVDDPSWTGEDVSSSTLFTILKETVTFTFTNLLQQYTGNECIPVGITTIPTSSYIIGPTYIDKFGNILQTPPAVPGTYTVRARISDDDPLYTGSASATLVITPPIIETNCSPALFLDTLNHGGNLASGNTDLIQAQVLRTAALRLASTAQAVPCVLPGPPISKYAGGVTSGALLEQQIQAAQLCTAQQNLAVAKLRMLPLPPFNPALRFAQYQRPALVVPPPPVIFNAGLPVAQMGPCTNVVGITTTIPLRPLTTDIQADTLQPAPFP